MEYLLELRKRLLWCFSITAITFCILCFFANPLYQLLAKPLISQFAFKQALIATKIASTFLVPMKFVLILSLFLLSPYFLYHLWAFIAPALYPHERRMTWILLFPSVFLFYVGVCFSYVVVLPILFHFFIKMTPPSVELRPDIGQYLDFTLQMLMAFGLSFEVPIIVLVLVRCHIFSREQLRSARPYIIIGAFVVGMLLTPPDVISQTMLAVPLWLLYELGLWLARWF